MSIFHRYNSTIHGNYRRAYLRSGLATGLLLALYVLVRLLAGTPLSSPVSLVSDAILLVAIFLFMAHYRNSLPDKRITLKEALLFGFGTAILAGLLYALLLWAIAVAFPRQTLLFNDTYQLSTDSYPLHYWAAWWAFLAAVGNTLLGSFGAFVAAIILRNEKAQIKQSNNQTIKQ